MLLQEQMLELNSHNVGLETHSSNSIPEIQTFRFHSAQSKNASIISLTHAKVITCVYK